MMEGVTSSSLQVLGMPYQYIFGLFMFFKRLFDNTSKIRTTSNKKRTLYGNAMESHKETIQALAGKYDMFLKKVPYFLD